MVGATELNNKNHKGYGESNREQQVMATKVMVRARELNKKINMYYKLRKACVTNWCSFVLLKLRVKVVTNCESFIFAN